MNGTTAKEELDNFYNTKWQILDLENITRNYDRDQNVEVEKEYDGELVSIGFNHVPNLEKSGFIGVLLVSNKA